jgi:hypothetical protein
VVSARMPACQPAPRSCHPSLTLSVQQSRALPRLHARHAARPARVSTPAVSRACPDRFRPSTLDYRECVRVHDACAQQCAGGGCGCRAGQKSRRGWAGWWVSRGRARVRGWLGGSVRVCVRTLRGTRGGQRLEDDTDEGRGRGALRCARARQTSTRSPSLLLSLQSRLSLLTAPCSQSAGQYTLSHCSHNAPTLSTRTTRRPNPPHSPPRPARCTPLSPVRIRASAYHARHLPALPCSGGRGNGHPDTPVA